MTKNYVRTFLTTAGIGCVFLITNMLLYQIPSLNAQSVDFVYPLPAVYLFFFIFSIIILGILIKTSEKNISVTGYAFLLLTTVKLIASYFFAKPLISKTIEFPTEKANFFFVFLLFLAIEAYFTARLLNNRQQ